MAAVSMMAKGFIGLSTAIEVFLIFTTQLFQYNFSVLFLFALFSDEPEVFLPKYSQTAILHAAHFRRVVNQCAHKAHNYHAYYNTHTMHALPILEHRPGWRQGGPQTVHQFSLRESHINHWV